MMNLSIILPILAGYAGGLLVNYLSDVLPHTRRLTQPVCSSCNHPFPLVRYLLLQSCSACGAKRTLRTYLVPLALIAASIYIWIAPPAKLNFWMGFLLLVYFGVVFVIDMEHRLILHPVSITGAVIGLALGWYAYGIIPSLVGGAAGFGMMFALFYLGELFRRYMSKRRGEEVDDALGFGDVALAGVIGLLVGWPLIFAGLIFAILAGGVVSLLIVAKMLITKKYEAFAAIPYGPFLILGAAYIVFF